MNDLVRSQIHLNQDSQTRVYQRSSDSFFCLSQACLDIKENPISFLKSPGIDILFLSKSQHKIPIKRITVAELVRKHPDLIYYDRSCRKIESGVWLHELFLPSFQAWSQKIKTKNWDRTIENYNRFDYIYQVPASYYEFRRVSLTEANRIVAIRESDGFVKASSLNRVEKREFYKLFTQRSFITTLEAARDSLSLELDYSILNEQSIAYSERVYRLYKSLYDRTRIEGEDVFWLHPKLAQLFDSSFELRAAIADWFERTNCSSKCYIVEIGNAESRASEEGKMSAFRLAECKTTLYDAIDAILLKIIHTESRWQFVLDLSKLKIYVSRSLLLQWGIGVSVRELSSKNLKSADFLAEAEIRRSKESTSTLTRLIEKNDLVCLDYCKIQHQEPSAALIFSEDECEYNILVPQKVAETICQVLSIAKSHLSVTENLEQIRIQLASLGYASPLLKASTDSNTAVEEYREIKFKEITVRQRLSDGFVSANDFYRPFGKNLDRWLKNDSTFEFFKAVARKERLNYNYAKSGNSSYTRVSGCFGALIERKGGSPKFGGGTWIHPLIALNLAQSISAEFAAEAVYILRDYYIDRAKEQTRLITDINNH